MFPSIAAVGRELRASAAKTSSRSAKVERPASAARSCSGPANTGGSGPRAGACGRGSGLIMASVVPLRSAPWNRARKTALMIHSARGIATPLITGITLAALQLLPPGLPDQLRALGANRAQLVLRMWIEARVPLLAAAMAGFGKAISEVGAVTIVGGNIHGQTQVMTTAIVEHVGRGAFNAALVYGAVLLSLAFAVNGLLASVQHRGASWARS